VRIDLSKHDTIIRIWFRNFLFNIGDIDTNDNTTSNFTTGKLEDTTSKLRMTNCLINEVNPGRAGIPISKSRDKNNPENPEIQIPGFDNPEIVRDPGIRNPGIDNPSQHHRSNHSWN
jgi:hypothetical protein